MAIRCWWPRPGPYVINPDVYPKDKLNYDLERDLIQITGLVRIHHSLVATPSLPVSSLGELIALAKEKPGTLTYGTAGRRLRTAHEHGPA